MAKILLTAELGAGFAHVARLRAIAEQFRARGDTCTFAVSDLDAARDYLGRELGPLLQAPLKLHPPSRPLKVLLSYTSVLYNCGFDEPSGLATRLRAWTSLFALTGCDYLIADHSPTAVLAAKTISLPTAIIGAGFSIPPMQTPFPHFGGDVACEEAQLRNNDNAVLQVINQALEMMNCGPLPTLQTMFDSSFPALLTYAELDHYGLPRDCSYLGVPDFSQGIDISWGNRREPRLFAYLRPGSGLPSLLKAIQKLPAQTVLRIDGADIGELKPYLRPGLVVVDRQVNIRKLAQSCDIYVGYAAHGTVAEMLLAGKPGLLVPTTRERSMVARRTEMIGAAIVLPAADDAPYSAALTRLIEDPDLRQNAGKFAARYASKDRNEILPAWCQSFLNRSMADRRKTPAPSAADPARLSPSR